MSIKKTMRMKQISAMTTFVFIALANWIITAKADIIHVPKEHKKIQAALNVAKKGDTIIVAPGK